MIDEVGFDTCDVFSMIDQNWNSLLPFESTSNVDGISADLSKYFFDKMKKKGNHDAEKIYDQYLEAGISPKASIALTDRKFFPMPHEKDHGNYLRNVIGDALFKKEQAAREGKIDWIVDEKTNSAAIKTLEAFLDKSKIYPDKSKKHEYKNKSPGLGGYLLGIAEIIAGGALIVTSGVVEVASCGALTIGVGLAAGTGVSLIGLGLAKTAANAKDISIPTWKSTDLQDLKGTLYKKGLIDPSLPANPDDMKEKPEWEETTHSDAGKNGHRTFENKETGEKLRHDQEKPGKPGHDGHDHWHRLNPNKTGKHDEYLDNEHNPVARHSDESHLYAPDNAWWNE